MKVSTTQKIMLLKKTASCARSAADTLQTILQSNNVTGGEQERQMANLIVQNQELKTQVDSVRAQLAQLQTVLKAFIVMGNGNQTNNNYRHTNYNLNNKRNKNSNQAT